MATSSKSANRLWYGLHAIALPLTMGASISFYLGSNFMAFLAPLAIALPVLFIWHAVIGGLALSRLHHSALLAIAILAAISPQWMPFMAYQSAKSPHPSSIRIATWNVHQWRNMPWTDLESTAKEMQTKALSLQADILCLQDIGQAGLNGLEAHYPYHVQVGQLAVLSQWPIKQWDQQAFTSTFHGHDHFMWTNIVIKDDQGQTRTLTVANAHLVTTTFVAKDFREDQDQNGMPQVMLSSYGKLMQTAGIRSRQVDQLAAWRDQQDQPVVIAGDFNDLPSSYSYQMLTTGMKDAFLEGGIGLGRSYTGLKGLPLRIDWLIMSPSMQVTASAVDKQSHSDHHPLWTDAWLQSQPIKD